jgi:hypothetical protein
MAELVLVLTLGAEKQRVTLTTGGKPFVIGRGADADLRVDRPSLSRRHCELRLVEAGLELRDLGSANGTAVNGKATKTVALASGDLIRLGGDAIVRVEYGADVPLPPPSVPDATPRKAMALPPTARLDTPAPPPEDEGPGTGSWLTTAAEGSGDVRCQRCKRRISLATVSDGLAFEWGEDVFCPECRESANLDKLPEAMGVVMDALTEEGFTGLERISGDGTLSPVFKARQWALDVAVKALPILPGISPKRIDRFRAESRAMKRITHPNVAAVLDVKERPEVIFFVMDLIRGESLLEKIERLGKLPVAEATSLGLALARALEATAAEGIVHRNVKPENVLFAGTVPKLIDFGLAKDLRLMKAFTGTEETLGTIRYMAPEQVKDARKADVRSDIYSLAATLYQAYTGKLPYPRHSELELLKSAVTGRLPDFGPTPLDEIPEAVAALLRRCLKRNAADRPESATKLVEELTLAASSHGAAEGR